MSKVEISVCIVAFKAERELNQCLKSIFSFPPKKSFEVIVVDNNEDSKKTLNVLKRYGKAKYIKSLQNKGYGAGNNLGATMARGDVFLFLNPDTQVTKDAIDNLYNFLKTHTKAAVVGPQILSYEKDIPSQTPTSELTPLRGLFALSFINKLWPDNTVSQSYYRSFDFRNDSCVGTVPGSAIMIKAPIFRSIGGFDEKLFLYFEENDICKRLAKKNWEVWMTPKAKVFHHWEKSTSHVKPQQIQRYFNESRFYYFRKHFGIVSALIVELFARFGKREAIGCAIVCGVALAKLYGLY